MFTRLTGSKTLISQPRLLISSPTHTNTHWLSPDRDEHFFHVGTEMEDGWTHLQINYHSCIFIYIYIHVCSDTFILIYSDLFICICMYIHSYSDTFIFIYIQYISIAFYEFIFLLIHYIYYYINLSNTSRET